MKPAWTKTMSSSGQPSQVGLITHFVSQLLDYKLISCITKEIEQMGTNNIESLGIFRLQMSFKLLK